MFSLKKSIYKTRRDPGCECVGGEVVIGNQIWTCTNLDVTTFRNGDVIPQVTNQNDWANTTTPAWCYYNYDPANAVFGKMYNWYAVRDPRGLAPQGYHIPTDDEWTILTDYLGGLAVAGGKMKKISNLWLNPNVLATNSSCFSGLPGGSTAPNGSIGSINGAGYWWSFTESSDTNAWQRSLYSSNGQAFRFDISKRHGLSVRLVKEDVPLEPFDYIIFTYQYEPPQNYDFDLDTITTFRYATSTLSGSDASTIQGFIPGTGVVGCGTGNGSANSKIPSGSDINTAYMVYGGDDNSQSTTGTYGESVVINFKNLKDANITTSNDIVVELYAGWHSQSPNYGPFPITLKYETFIGGTISREVVGGVTTNRYVTTGISVSSPQISPPKTITDSGCSFGIEGSQYAKQHVASINYNLVTKVASVIFH